MSQAIQGIETKIGHTFQNQRLCDEALTAAGVRLQMSATSHHFDGNASLALIGDGILRIGVGLRSRDLHESKGETSIRMQTVVNNNNLAKIFDAAQLGPHVIANPSQRGVISPNTKATVVEALLGAVYEDADMEAALAVMRHLQIE
ncbi:hypothetical protein PspLS_00141 [Pyricularia sp. CBS 133598]|nr:hypothetical protein PspLS_00141 [Pyricularia sp. CBS 133598]